MRVSFSTWIIKKCLHDTCSDIEPFPTTDLEVFQKVLRLWEHYKMLMKWNMRSFAYLSRYYIVNHAKPTLLQVALSIFLEQIFKFHSEVVSRVTQDYLMRERSGEDVSRELIASAIDLFSSMGSGDNSQVYTENFLTPFLGKTSDAYESLLLKWQKDCPTAPDFLVVINATFAAEEKRCHEYFSADDTQAIMSHVEAVLLESPITHARLLDATDGFGDSLKRRDVALLKQYFELFSRRESGIRRLASILHKQIIHEGQELSRLYAGDDASVDVVQYVTSMMQLQTDFPGMLASCFGLEFNMSKAVREGLEHAFNGGVDVVDQHTALSRRVPFSEWLAVYADVILQTSQNDSVAEIERVVNMLSYVTDRDRFLAYTRERFSDRILFSSNNKKFSDASERAFIQGIRQKCGPASTAYLEGMLSDYSASKVFDAEEVLRQRGKPPPFSISLLVAKKGIWPHHLGQETLRVPSYLSRVLEDLQEAYLEGTLGRLLAWSHANSTAEVQGNYATGSCLFSLSGMQALLLLAFNDGGVLSYQQLIEACGASDEQLRLSMQPLVKGKLLNRRGSPREVIQSSDVFEANVDYPVRTRKVRLQPSLVRISVSASDTISKLVEDDRKPVVDACLVRIVKSQKTIEHSDLVSQCQQLLSAQFIPDVRIIKQRIEELIRKEYFERESPTSTKYRYIV